MNQTRMTIEVVVTHWDTTNPIGAVQMVTGHLTFPAIKSVKVISAKTNYRQSEFSPVDLSPLDRLG
jgi:hypothetical protein